MMGSWRAKIGLIFFSTLFTILLCEWIFRIILFGNGDYFEFLRQPSYYASYVTYGKNRVYRDDYWKLNYLFQREFNIEHPHPMLGWTGFFDRITLKHQDQERVGQKKPVLLYGDSFAMCAEEVPCFEDILNGDSAFSSGHFLLNYGVGGYGVDQIYLLFKETVGEFEKPFIIFSLLTTDMDRCMLSVRDAQKPYFTPTQNGIELNGVPIVLSSEAYFENNPPEITSYLFKKLQNTIIEPLFPDKQRAAEYRQEIQALNKLILEKVFVKLKEYENNFVVLIFQPEHHGMADWRLPFLRDLLEENEIPYICELDLRESDTTYSGYTASNYALPLDGHPTKHLNDMISNELRQFIQDSSYRDKVGRRNATWRERKPLRDLDYYKNLILKTPEWLEVVKAKAKAKNVPLDSMVAWDARYMIKK